MEKVAVRSLSSQLRFPQLTRLDELFTEWQVASSEGTLPKDFWSEDTIDCPRDGTKLRKHYFAGSTIGVDQCPACGIFWFDGGELHAVTELALPNPQQDLLARAFITDSAEFNETGKRASEHLGNLGLAVGTPLVGLQAVAFLLGETLLNFFELRSRMSDLRKRKLDTES